MMFRCFRKAKIHNATVTDANIDYEGSIEIDSKILSEAGILPDEKVQVLDISNGNRLETYVIPSEEDGCICLNGAAAKLVGIGDKLIIISYCWISEGESLVPITVVLGEENKIKEATKLERPR